MIFSAAFWFAYSVQEWLICASTSGTDEGESTAMQMHHNPSLIVQVTDGMTHVTRDDGITAELTAMGSWAWRNAHSTYEVRNVGTAPVEFVIQEARRAM